MNKEARAWEARDLVSIYRLGWRAAYSQKERCDPKSIHTSNSWMAPKLYSKQPTDLNMDGRRALTEQLTP